MTPAVGGIVEHQPGQLCIKTFTTALFLCAKGQRLIGAELGPDGVEVRFIFEKEARDVMTEYHRERERLSRVQSQVRLTGTLESKEIHDDPRQAKR